MKFYRNGFFILVIIFFIGTITFYGARNSAQEKVNERIVLSFELNKQALQFLTEKEHKNAREKLLKSLQLNHLNAETFVYLAFVEMELGNYQGAYEAFASALNMEATSVDIIKNIAELLIKGGYPREAIHYLQHGLNDYPGDDTLLFLLGKAYFLSGNFDASIQIFQPLLDLSYASAETNKYLGLNFYLIGKREKAKEYYTKHLLHEGVIGHEELFSVEELHEKIMDMWGTNNG